MEVYEIRRINLRFLLNGRSQAAKADQWDTSPSTISQIVGSGQNRQLGERLARKIEMAEGLVVGWLDNVHEHPEPVYDELSIAGRLRSAMARTGLTEAQLSVQAGVSTSTVHRLLNEASDVPRAGTVNKLANVLSVSFDWLLRGEPSQGDAERNPNERPAGEAEAFLECARHLDDVARLLWERSTVLVSISKSLSRGADASTLEEAIALISKLPGEMGLEALVSKALKR